MAYKIQLLPWIDNLCIPNKPIQNHWEQEFFWEFLSWHVACKTSKWLFFFFFFFPIQILIFRAKQTGKNWSCHAKNLVSKALYKSWTSHFVIKSYRTEQLYSLHKKHFMVSSVIWNRTIQTPQFTKVLCLLLYSRLILHKPISQYNSSTVYLNEKTNSWNTFVFHIFMMYCVLLE